MSQALESFDDPEPEVRYAEKDRPSEPTSRLWLVAQLLGLLVLTCAVASLVVGGLFLGAVVEFFSAH